MTGGTSLPVCTRRTVATLMLALVVASCSSGTPGRAGGPALRVVTAYYPLAEAARLIGGRAAEVTDVVPPGADPFTFVPPPAQLKSAGLIVNISAAGPGASGSPPGSGPAIGLGGSGPGLVWLDPQGFETAVRRLAAAMAGADPSAGPVFRRNADSLVSELSSLSIDFSSTLSTCRSTRIFTADGAWSAAAARYGLDDRVVAPGKAPAMEQLAGSSGGAAVFSEPWTDNSGVEDLARRTGNRVRNLDTLAGIPAQGWPNGAGYLTLMEAQLGQLSRALGCETDGQ